MTRALVVAVSLLVAWSARADDSAAWLRGLRGAGSVADAPSTLRLPEEWAQSFEAMLKETARSKLEQAACLEHRGEFLVTSILSGSETLVKRSASCRGLGSVHTHPVELPSGRAPAADEFVFSSNDLRVIGISADHVNVLVRKDGIDLVLRTASYRPGGDARFLQKLLAGCWLMHLEPGDTAEITHRCIALGFARIGLAYYSGSGDGALKKVTPAAPAFIDPATLDFVERSPAYQNPVMISFAKATLKAAGRYAGPITGEHDQAFAAALQSALGLAAPPTELEGATLLALVMRFACGSVRQALNRSCRERFADIGRTFDKRRVLRAMGNFRAGGGGVELEAIEETGRGQSSPAVTILRPRIVERFDPRRSARYMATTREGERIALRVRFANGNSFDGYADERGAPAEATEYATSDWVYTGGMAERFQFHGEGKLRMRSAEQDGWVFDCVFERARCVSGQLTKPGDEVFEVAHPGESRAIARIVRRIR